MKISWPEALVAISLIYATTFIVFQILRSLVLKRDIEIARRYIKSAVGEIRGYQFTESQIYEQLDKLQ